VFLFLLLAGLFSFIKPAAKFIGKTIKSAWGKTKKLAKKVGKKFRRKKRKRNPENDDVEE